jgi:hypothetical protein
MNKQFGRDGVSFRYPADWRLEQEEAGGGWTAALQSPGAAFLTVTYDPDMPSTEDMAQTALDALRSEHRDVEAEPVVENVAGRLAVGHDINFFSLDAVVTCWTRSLYGDAGTLLVLCQTDEPELERAEAALRGVLGSLQFEED